MMTDTTCLTHTGSGNNDLRLSIKIDGLGLITGDCQMKVREPDRADTGIDAVSYTHLALPCATQNELLLEDAKQLVANGCTAVCEGANMPTTLEATKYLQDNGVPVSYTHLDVYKRQILQMPLNSYP